MINLFGSYASIIGLFISLLSFYFAYLAAKRSKISSTVLNQTNAKQELEKCSSFIKQIKRILIKRDFELSEELLNALRKRFIVLSTRHEKVLPQEKKKQYFDQLSVDLNSVIYEIQKHKDDPSKFEMETFTNLLEYLDDQILELIEEINLASPALPTA